MSSQLEGPALCSLLDSPPCAKRTAPSATCWVWAGGEALHSASTTETLTCPRRKVVLGPLPDQATESTPIWLDSIEQLPDNAANLVVRFQKDGAANHHNSGVKGREFWKCSLKESSGIIIASRKHSSHTLNLPDLTSQSPTFSSCPHLKHTHTSHNTHEGIAHVTA